MTAQIVISKHFFDSGTMDAQRNVDAFNRGYTCGKFDAERGLVPNLFKWCGYSIGPVWRQIAFEFGYKAALEEFGKQEMM